MISLRSYSLGLAAFGIGIFSLAASAGAASDPAPRCLRNTEIKYTSTPDDKTLLFVMKNGTTYRSDLGAACIGLTLGGYSYVSEPNDVVCGGEQTIRALQTRSICRLGAFTQVSAPAK